MKARIGLGAWIGWGALAIEAVYLVALHQGVGLAPAGVPPAWWYPTRSWLHVDWISALEETPVRAVVMAGVPAAVLAAFVFRATSSAVARWLAISGILTALLFGFYGFVAPRVWQFFHWRGSLVMVTIGASVGAALTSPWLASSWLRRHWAWKLALYLPILLGTVTLLRQTTGTDETLAFNFSPWPAVTIFGLEIGAYAVTGLLLGLAIAVAGLSAWPARPARAAAGVGLGVATPIVWMGARFGSLPGGLDWELAVVAMVAAGLVAWTSRPDRTAELQRRASLLGLGGVLVLLPLFIGRALSTADYTVTRFVRAQELIDALSRYYAKQDGYPDSLDELVELGYLKSLPRPRVGSDLVTSLVGFEPEKFSYQSLGSSYVLEFDFTEWVQCAYNPPWEDEDDVGEDEDDGVGEAWSCPDSRPELW